MRLWKVWHGASVPRVGQAPPPFGPGMSTIYLREATRLERWENEWDDERDQTEWRLYRGTTLVETRRVRDSLPVTEDLRRWLPRIVVMAVPLTVAQTTKCH